MPDLRIAVGIGQRIRLEYPVDDVNREVPDAISCPRLGQFQFDVCRVAGVVHLPSIHDQRNHIAGSDGDGLFGLPTLLLTIVDHPVGDPRRAGFRKPFHPPGDAVAARCIRIGNQPFDSQRTLHRTPPSDHRCLVRRRMHGHSARRNGQGQDADRLVGSIRQQAGRLWAAPSVDGLVALHPGQLLLKAARDFPRNRSADSGQLRPVLQQPWIQPAAFDNLGNIFGRRSQAGQRRQVLLAAAQLGLHRPFYSASDLPDIPQPYGWMCRAAVGLEFDPRALPDDVILLVAIAQIVSGQRDHHVRTGRHVRQRVPQFLARHYRRDRLHPPRRASLAAELPDRVESPQRLLCPLDFQRQRPSIVRPGTVPTLANPIQQHRLRRILPRQSRPQRRQVTGIQTLFGGDLFDGLPSAEQRIPICKGGRQIFTHWQQPALIRLELYALQVHGSATPVGGEPAVKRLNLCQPLVGLIATRRPGRKHDAVGQQHRMLGDAFRRVQIFLDQRRRHPLTAAHVGEPLARRTVDREFVGRLESIDARQVVDGIGVLSVTQPAQDDWSRISGTGLCFPRQKAVDPGLHSRQLDVARLRRIFGRHLSAEQNLANLQPGFGLLADVSGRLKDRQIEIRFRRFPAVAVVAVTLDQRSNLDRVRVIQIHNRALLLGRKDGTDGQHQRQNQAAGVSTHAQTSLAMATISEWPPVANTDDPNQVSHKRY